MFRSSWYAPSRGDRPRRSDRSRRRVAAERSRVVNVVGPLGAGKTGLLTMLAARPGPVPMLIDGVDSERRARDALRLVHGPDSGAVVIASRLPLMSRPGWAAHAPGTVEVGRWSPTDIRSLAASFGGAVSAHAGLVVRLSGGIPLIADVLCRALAAGAGPEPVGALADLAATDILRRLAAETDRQADREPDRQGPAEADGPAQPQRPGAAADGGLVPLLATLDGADDDLLTALIRPPSDAFDRLRRCSLVRAERHGLTVAEPYRSILDLAYRWRHPARRGELAAHGARLRQAQLAATADGPLRTRLADQILYLSARPQVRSDIYPEVPGELSIRRAEAGDEAAITRLVRRWAEDEGLSADRAQRMLRLWLEVPDHGFHLAVDLEDRAVGAVNLTPLDVSSAAALDPLLQQHTERLLIPGRSGTVVGMMAAEPQFAGAQPAMVRHILASGIACGRLVVSTPWLPYQQMATRLEFRRLGQTRHDVYRCGRTSGVFLRTFTGDELPTWVRGLQDPGTAATVERIRAALQTLRSANRPAPDLAGLLRAAVDELMSSPAAVDAEAGQILSRYYFARADSHELLAHRLHLSRATYFRRLEHGLRRVAAAMSPVWPR